MREALRRLIVAREAINNQYETVTSSTSASMPIATFIAGGHAVRSAVVTVPFTSGGVSKVRLIRCGKNLFDPSVPFKNPSDTTLANSTKRIFTPATYCLGAGWSNYFGPSMVTSYSVSGETISIVSKNGYAAGYAFPLVPGETYILSAQSKQYGETRIVWYRNDGSYISYGDIEISDTAVTIPAQGAMTVITLAEQASLSGSKTAVFTGMQLEKGTAVTAYEPYNGNAFETAMPEGFYGGTVDMVSGQAVSKYASDGTLLETPVNHSLTTHDILTLVGTNNVYTDIGTVELTYTKKKG